MPLWDTNGTFTLVQNLPHTVTTKMAETRINTRFSAIL
nr:MAG TPA: hypothetical protein [Caudoviricetes sp.]